MTKPRPTADAPGTNGCQWSGASRSAMARPTPAVQAKAMNWINGGGRGLETAAFQEGWIGNSDANLTASFLYRMSPDFC